MKLLPLLLATALLAAAAARACPFLDAQRACDVDAPLPRAVKAAHADAVRNVDFAAVKADIKSMVLKASQAHWPADYGTYAGLFVRLAWHAAGSYRRSDGRGGADGGRQRFDPERSWEDNTNLDKARALLWPVKQKYGVGLSWADLIVLAGDAAFESTGAETLGFCGGRLDDADGAESLPLGPSALQEAEAPCDTQGDCKPPLGTKVVGLIYVDPHGHMGKPEPAGSAPDVRDTFARMGMNDAETVALIGGGHAIGKTHGACPAGPGKPPREDPENPWPGMCGTGRGADAYTSGFEGPWTTRPTVFDNEFFVNLRDYEWALSSSPADEPQWYDTKGALRAPLAHGNGTQRVMMLTTDLSLMHDAQQSYQRWVKTYADDDAEFRDAFKRSWYKLMTRDMGPHERCVGALVPPAQPFQNPLPPTPPLLPVFEEVAADVRAIVRARRDATTPGGEPGAGYFARLAWQSASSFRVTDYRGGANGGRIRFAPQREWPLNAHLEAALRLLEPVQKKYAASNLSWADLIVIAGSVDLEEAGAPPLPFCGGRTDAPTAGDDPDALRPTLTGNATDTLVDLRRAAALLGLGKRAFVALMGGHAIGSMHVNRSGATGRWTQSGMTLSNEYFVNLLSHRWLPHKVEQSNFVQYKAEGADLYCLRADYLLTIDAEFAAIAQDFASDNELFLSTFASAWTRIMNADRFDGPLGNVCDKLVA